MTSIEAVIFDGDGTILDTREFIFQAFERTLGAYGHTVHSREVLTSKMGAHLVDMYEMFAPEGDSEKLAEHHRELHREELLPLVAAYEGLHELLQHLRDDGIKLGVCTNRSGGAKDLLRHIGVFDDFEAIVTADDMKHHKPDPEGLLETIDRLGVSAERSVMVGDTVADIGAGKAAGVACTIGVTHGFGAENILRDAGADYIAHHLGEIPGILAKHR